MALLHSFEQFWLQLNSHKVTSGDVLWVRDRGRGTWEGEKKREKVTGKWRKREMWKWCNKLGQAIKKNISEMQGRT